MERENERRSGARMGLEGIKREMDGVEIWKYRVRVLLGNWTCVERCGGKGEYVLGGGRG